MIEIVGFLASIVTIILFLWGIINHLKPGIKYVDLKYSESEKILKKFPKEKYELKWPLEMNFEKVRDEGYKKVYIFKKFRKYELQVLNNIPPSNHILVYRKR